MRKSLKTSGCMVPEAPLCGASVYPLSSRQLLSRRLGGYDRSSRPVGHADDAPGLARD